MAHTVDKRDDRGDQRELGASLKQGALSLLAALHRHHLLLVELFQVFLQGLALAGTVSAPLLQWLEQYLQRVLGALALADAVVIAEQEEQQQEDGHHDGQNDVETEIRLVETLGSRLEIAVLASLFLDVEITVAAPVARRLVVDGTICYRQLLLDACHQIGGLLDER